MEKPYIHRLFDETLEFLLRSVGAVVVVGPKWCGKSRTCQRHAKTIIDLMPTAERKSYQALARLDPNEFFALGEKPMLIDEWQHVSFLWDDIKAEIDRSSSFGEFILTGSVTDRERIKGEDRFRHSGSGRILRKFMRTMSLFETGESNGTVSLRDLKEGKFQSSKSSLTLRDYAFCICRGGWPMAVGEEREIALQQARNYYEAVATVDLFSIDGIALEPDEEKAKLVLRAYARNVSIPAADVTLLSDCVGSSESFSAITFSKYLAALSYLFVIEPLPAWNPNLRSKTAIRTKPTRHFVDPSIGSAALGLTPEGLFRDIPTFGFMFESLVIHDLRCYGDAIGAHLYKYRDAKGREADAVMQFADGSWALFEVKLGGEEDIEEAAKKLLAIAADIDTSLSGAPAFLMVVTKGSFSYRRADGVYVVPLGCLRN